MKDSLNQENNKSNNIFQTFSTNFMIFKHYTLNKYKNISNKLYSFYPLSSKKVNSELNNINNEPNKNKPNIIKRENKLFNKENIDDNNKNELLIYNNAQIKKNIYIYLENELMINNTKIELKNNDNNKLAQINKYKEFKTKTIIYFFSSIILGKYYNIISITSLCIISIMKIFELYTNNIQIKLILDNLWNISNNTSKNIFSNISEIISTYIDKIPLNEKYTKNSFDELISNIQKELRDKCNFFIHVIKEIKKEIKNIEEQFYDLNNIKNNMILEYKLRFFYIFCNILFSDLFYSSFVQAYENEIMKQIEEIKGKFEEKNEKTFLSIIFDIDSFRNKQLVINEENNEILTDNNEDNDDILMNYQKCLQSILI